MKNRKTLAAIAVAAAGTSMAYADLSVSVDDASFSRRYRELADGAPRIDDDMILSGSDVIGFGTTEHLFDRSADPSVYPSVNAFSAQHLFRTEVSNTRFAVEWDFASNGDLTRALGSGENLRANMQFLINASIAIDAGTEYRVAWSGEGGNFVGDMTGLTNSAYLAVDGDVISPFSLGFGNAAVSIPGDVSFTAVAAADGIFDLTLEGIFTNSASAGQPITSWDQLSRGSFVIEVVPAPGTAMLLAAAGLVVRRKR